MDGHHLGGPKHGVALFLEGLYREYASQHPYDTVVVGLEPSARLPESLRGFSNVTTTHYRFGGSTRFCLELAHLMRQIKPDIAHFQYFLPFFVPEGVRTHVTVHDVLYEDYPQFFGFIYRNVRKLLVGFSVRRASIVSTVSVYSKGRMEKLLGGAARDVVVLSPGISLMTVGLPRGESSEPYVLYVSRFERRKNHLRLLKCFLKLHEDVRDLKLKLVGFDVDGTLQTIRSFIEARKISRRVEILSNVPGHELATLYAQAIMVIYPSLCEGFGLPIIEALMLNPVTLYSNTTAMRDLVAGTRTFDPTDEEDMLRCMRAALSSRETFIASWDATRDQIRRRYDWAKTCKALEALYS